MPADSFGIHLLVSIVVVIVTIMPQVPVTVAWKFSEPQSPCPKGGVDCPTICESGDGKCVGKMGKYDVCLCPKALIKSRPLYDSCEMLLSYEQKGKNEERNQVALFCERNGWMAYYCGGTTADGTAYSSYTCFPGPFLLPCPDSDSTVTCGKACGSPGDCLGMTGTGYQVCNCRVNDRNKLASNYGFLGPNKNSRGQVEARDTCARRYAKAYDTAHAYACTLFWDSELYPYCLEGSTASSVSQCQSICGSTGQCLGLVGGVGVCSCVDNVVTPKGCVLATDDTEGYTEGWGAIKEVCKGEIYRCQNGFEQPFFNSWVCYPPATTAAAQEERRPTGRQNKKKKQHGGGEDAMIRRLLGIVKRFLIKRNEQDKKEV